MLANCISGIRGNMLICLELRNGIVGFVGSINEYTFSSYLRVWGLCNMESINA